MNVERCIALHDEILRQGWVGSGRSPESLESTCKTWFDTFGDEADAVRSDLAPDLVKFLTHARVVYDPEFGVDLHFFYWVQNLASPDFMFEQAEDLPDQGENGRVLVLYAMSNFTGHFCGLVYDQKRQLCIISPTIYETDEIFEQKVWYPLETGLEFWLGQVRKGRIATLPEVKNRNYGNDRFDPWEFVPYNDVMLEENIDAFNHLAEAIEARMPSTVNTTEAEEVVHGLVDESVLQTINLPQRFAYEFLRRTRRPRFQIIAPGLEVLTTPTFPDQPFSCYLSSSISSLPPILLFRSKSNYTDETTTNVRTSEPIAQLFPQFSRITTYPAGLYLRPTSTTKVEDECLFILPFGIGANGYARKSDGSKFGRKKNGEDSHVDLYRPGYQPFEEQHEQSLVDVLESWRGMVERGDWPIDENGVAGGMDVWKEADSKEGWEGYVVPRAVEGVER
ncbi:Nn.00g053790.m01.CDS01 [Neocucurbitaria sp. VM-36]